MAISDFLVNTDYPNDKYVCYLTGSVTATGLGGFSFDRPAHGLTYIPLIYVQWSETPDFSIPRELLQNSGDLYATSEPWVIQSLANTEYVEFYFNNWGASTKTLYFRAWGFMPSNVSIESPHTSSISGLSDFVLNSDMNYLKIYNSGIVDVTSITVVVPHNLGYSPVVMIWRDQFTGANQIIEPLFSPLVFSPFEDGTPSVTIDSIIFPYQGFGAQKYHYRIYLDEI